MPCSGNCWARSSRLNCGFRRECGNRRTSTRQRIPYARSRARNSSKERLEWPMVKIWTFDIMLSLASRMNRLPALDGWRRTLGRVRIPRVITCPTVPPVDQLQPGKVSWCVQTYHRIRRVSRSRLHRGSRVRRFALTVTVCRSAATAEQHPPLPQGYGGTSRSGRDYRRGKPRPPQG